MTKCKFNSNSKYRSPHHLSLSFRVDFFFNFYDEITFRINKRAKNLLSGLTFDRGLALISLRTTGPRKAVPSAVVYFLNIAHLKSLCSWQPLNPKNCVLFNHKVLIRASDEE